MLSWQTTLRLIPGSISSGILTFIASIVLLAASAAPNSVAQSDALPSASFPSTTASVPTIERKVNEVSLALTVTDKRGHLVRNLSESDFNIFDNGKVPDRITSFEAQTNLPLRVALVIDTSDSVTYRFKFEQKSGAVFFRHMLHAPADLGSVVAFNQNVHIAQQLTRNKKSLEHSLKRLRPGGETSVYDAVIAAAHQLTSPPGEQPSRHVMVLITDGEDNTSHAHLDDAVEAALRSESVVYVVSTNDLADAPEFPGDGDDCMAQLAEATGGRLLHSETDGDVATAFSKIEKDLRSQYAISYRPADNNPDGLFHHLIVLSPKNLHIFHRIGYFAR